MTTRKEMQNINKLVRIIQKEGHISKVQLILNSGFGISSYEKLKPFLEEIYPHKVQYDRTARIWKNVEEKR